MILLRQMSPELFAKVTPAQKFQKGVNLILQDLRNGDMLSAVQRMERQNYLPNPTMAIYSDFAYRGKAFKDFGRKWGKAIITRANLPSVGECSEFMLSPLTLQLYTKGDAFSAEAVHVQRDEADQVAYLPLSVGVRIGGNRFLAWRVWSMLFWGNPFCWIPPNREVGNEVLHYLTKYEADFLEYRTIKKSRKQMENTDGTDSTATE